MTIYKPKPADGKTEAQKSPLKSKVVVNDAKLLASKPKPATVAPATVRVIQARRRRSALLLGCFFLLIMVIIVVAIVGGIFLYQRLAKKVQHHQHVETAQFKYYEYQRSRSAIADRKRIDYGSFMENVEIDDEEYTHERLDVPPILGSSRSTIVHDFEKNMTAIVDRDRQRCYVMPLNRTAVQPPRNFLDLLIKYKSGYYLPDAEVVRDNYKVQLPAVENLDPFGVYIWLDCRYYDTFRLVHDDEALRIVSKRSACEVAGDTYCLGGAGAGQMMCLKLTSCTSEVEPHQIPFESHPFP